jgi:hypothetical protein
MHTSSMCLSLCTATMGDWCCGPQHGVVGLSVVMYGFVVVFCVVVLVVVVVVVRCSALLLLANGGLQQLCVGKRENDVAARTRGCAAQWQSGTACSHWLCGTWPLVCAVTAAGGAVWLGTSSVMVWHTSHLCLAASWAPGGTLFAAAAVTPCLHRLQAYMHACTRVCCVLQQPIQARPTQHQAAVTLGCAHSYRRQTRKMGTAAASESSSPRPSAAR